MAEIRHNRAIPGPNRAVRDRGTRAPAKQSSRDDGPARRQDRSPQRQLQRPAHNPWAIAITVTLATFMEALDTSIANVALPHIAGALSASVDESTWVLTSYLVSNAIVLPLSAWLSTMVGRKRF
jgi:hypothetical protein